MGSRMQFLVNSIVRVCQKLDRKDFGANHDGNVSALFEDKILATPTAESKGSIVGEMIITLDMTGKKVAGIGKPFSEMKLHLAAYRSRVDARAVVHAHPPFATARGLVGKPLGNVLPEAVVSIGEVIPVSPFAMPGAPENEEIVARALQQTDVFMMPGNGVLSIGSDVEQAYLRLELVEHVAKIDYYARQCGEPMTLSEDDLRALLEKRASLGLGPSHRCAVPFTGDAPADGKTDPLREIIASEIRKILEEESR